VQGTLHSARRAALAALRDLGAARHQGGLDAAA
jgi:hypothetical protein